MEQHGWPLGYRKLLIFQLIYQNACCLHSKLDNMSYILIVIELFPKDLITGRSSWSEIHMPIFNSLGNALVWGFYCAMIFFFIFFLFKWFSHYWKVLNWLLWKIKPLRWPQKDVDTESSNRCFPHLFLWNTCPLLLWWRGFVYKSSYRLVW